MAMGKRPTKYIEERDLVTGWRYVLTYMGRAGVTSGIKRQIRRRERRVARHELRASLPFHAFNTGQPWEWMDAEGYHNSYYEHLIINGKDVWVRHYEVEPWGCDWDEWNGGTELPYTTESRRYQ